MPRSSISRWKPRFVITVTATTLDAEVEGEDREDLVAVDDVPVAVDGQHPVAVAVERDAEVEAAGPHRLLEEREVGGAAAVVDVLAVRVRLRSPSPRRRGCSKASGAMSE